MPAEGSDQGDRREDQSSEPITFEKLLSKVAFLRYGSESGKRKDELIKELYRHLRRSDGRLISRQAIRHWADGSGSPLRNNALLFLRSYVLSNPVPQSEDRYDGATERKKVYNQLLSFFKANIVESDTGSSDSEPLQSLSTSIYPRSFNRIWIDVDMNTSDFPNIAENVTGLFLLYRRRFRISPQEKKFIACEVVHIYRTGRGLLFKHWYLHEGADLSVFEGAAVVIGDSLWLIGTSRRSVDRMRVMKFRYISDNHQNYRRVRWGIMLTDLPVPTAPEPVACRVLLLKQEAVVKVGTITIDTAKDLVRHLGEDDLEAPFRELILRTTDNNITAFSQFNSIRPQTSLEGVRQSDWDLRVNQQTIDNFF